LSLGPEYKNSSVEDSGITLKALSAIVDCPLVVKPSKHICQTRDNVALNLKLRTVLLITGFDLKSLHISIRFKFQIKFNSSNHLHMSEGVTKLPKL
jgi:hypothetical protein